MSPRLRIVGVLVLALLGALAFFALKPRTPRATAPASPRAQPETAVVTPTTAVRSGNEKPTAPAEKENATAASASGRRISALVLPESLRKPGVNSVADVLAQLDQMDESSRSDYFQSVLLFCLEQDRVGTAEMLANVSSEKWRDLGLTFALQHWAESDPVAALRWASDHPRAENDHARYFAAYEGFAERRPLEALRALDRPDLAGDWDQLARIVIHHFSENEHLAEARPWIEQLPAGNLRELLVRQMMRAWAKDSPNDAARWLASTASDETFRSGMGELLQVMLKDDPRFAAGLTQRFGEPQIREDFLADVIYSWARRDLGGAAAWLREQPSGPQLDAAKIRLIEAIAPNDPNEAKQWAETIGDPKKREEALRALRPTQ